MVTHSSILARKTPCTGEPDRLQSMGVVKSQTRLSTHTRWSQSFSSEPPSGLRAHLLPVISLFGRYISTTSHLLLGTNGSFFLDYLHIWFAPRFLSLVMATNTFSHLAPLPFTAFHQLCFSLSISYFILETQLNPHFLLEYSLCVLELSGPLRNPTTVAHQ